MNKIRVLRLVANNISFFKDGKFDLDLVNKLQVTNYDLDHSYFNLESSIYLPKTAVLKGVNASGKTTTLKLLDLFFNVYLKSSSLNSNNVVELLDLFYNNKPIILKIYYEFNKKIYKVVSNILQNKEIIVNKYNFTSEIIYVKDLNLSTTKSLLYERGFKEHLNRDTLSDETKMFLSRDKTINYIISNNSTNTYKSLIEGSNNLFNNNSLSDKTLNKLDVSIIRFLDHSIEDLTKSTNNRLIINENLTPTKELYLLTFTNGKSYEVTSNELLSLLSKGTLRGINILMTIKETLKTGGYFIVDELELHLNKSIIVDIIRLFKSNDTNPHNATLIFSTHYTEILDVFDRNDQIYISHRNDNYEMIISNYSDYDKKNQLKKSDSYFADTYNLGTAISYEKYKSLRNSFKGQFDND